jgi:phenylacetate-CoA ligase
MQKWTLSEIIQNAKQNSPYYKNLYKTVASDELKDLPVTVQADFWQSEVLTMPTPHGIVFKSGGSTGAPKYSYFTNVEWQSFTEAFGKGMAQGILADGDKVANLFYSGDLYASFLFIKDSLEAISADEKKISQFPIAGQTDDAQILKIIEEFSINVVAGVPSAVLTMFQKYAREKEKYKNIKIEKFLFGGEALYDDQLKAIKEIFPEIEVASIGYASVDGGILGYSSKDCQNGEHRMFDGVNIIEIVDPDTNEVITKKNVPGKVLLTNLVRQLMPIIRYPAGDLAMWVEDAGVPNRKFKLQGRSDEAARLGTLSVYFEDTRAMMMKVLKECSGIQFQMVLKHYHHRDELTLKIAGHELIDEKIIKERVLEAFIKEKTGYKEILKSELIHPLKIEIVEMNALEINTRTGKMKRVIDLRN